MPVVKSIDRVKYWCVDMPVEGKVYKATNEFHRDNFTQKSKNRQANLNKDQLGRIFH